VLRLKAAVRSSTARSPLANAVPVQVVRHTATHPSRRATSRVTSLTSGARATTGTPRAPGGLTRRLPDRRPFPLRVSSPATMTSGRRAGNTRRAATWVTVTSNPDAVSSYANFARTSSSAIESRTSGRIEPCRVSRSSTRWLFSIPQNPVLPTHTATACAMSVGFPTDRAGRARGERL
jgi:hypothetical protein